MIRPQAILVLLVVVVVVLSGAPTAALDARHGTPPPTASPEPPGTEPARVATATVASRAASTPIPLASPSPTATPALAERPSPPPVADEDQAVSIDQGTSGRREVALTFDAGAGRGYTAQILDLLRAEGVRATFGVTGRWAETNPDLMRRIVADGHMVLNHTYDHSSFTGFSTGADALTSPQRAEQLARTEQIIDGLTGYQTAPYFRFPYGDYDDAALADIAAAGYPFSIRWSCDSMAWMGTSAGEIVQRCGAEAEPGAIILLHVEPIADYEAVPGLIAALREQGYVLVTVEDLLQP